MSPKASLILKIVKEGASAQLVFYELLGFKRGFSQAKGWSFEFHINDVLT